MNKSIQRETGLSGDTAAPNLPLRIRGRGSLGRGLFVALCFLLVVVLSGLRTAQAAGRMTTVAAPSRSGLLFAVADFDGDHRPDVANVQTGMTGASSGDYLVRLRFSTSGRRYIRVVAPRGGIRIEARDVNGDHAPDLIVASAWLSKPVVILLNDGHGNFSQVDPASFPGAFGKSSPSWNNSNSEYACAVTLPRELYSGEISFALRVERLLCTKDFPLLPIVRSVSVRLIAISAERAPPAALLL